MLAGLGLVLLWMMVYFNCVVINFYLLIMSLLLLFLAFELAFTLVVWDFSCFGFVCVCCFVLRGDTFLICLFVNFVLHGWFGLIICIDKCFVVFVIVALCRCYFDYFVVTLFCLLESECFDTYGYCNLVTLVNSFG